MHHIRVKGNLLRSSRRLVRDYKDSVRLSSTVTTLRPTTTTILQRFNWCNFTHAGMFPTMKTVVMTPDMSPQDIPCGLQNLHYIYDPAGNITAIRDDAQHTIYFNGQVVRPDTKYTYDALYRLIEACGREHIGQASEPQATWHDRHRINLAHPNDGQAMRNYFEFYEYDEVGNILKFDHKAHSGNWIRAYEYDEPSLIELDKKSNRLSRTVVHPNGNHPILEPYTYDPHGNMTSMPHLPEMAWDFKDQMQMVDKGGGCMAYYVYDAGGQRVRKVIEQNGMRQKERFYLGGFEVYRKYNGDESIPKLERETLHVMDGQQRIAMVETRTQGEDDAPGQLIRYQLGNHLGSASLELDASAQIISYEEYYPYGSTSYQAVSSQTETPKRYRYTGMERDEETGLNYHAARYYAPWLGRWTSCDPVGLTDGVNVYAYAGDNAVRHSDRFGRDRADEVVSAIEGRLAIAQQTLTEVGELRADLTNAAEGYNRAIQDLGELAQQDTAGALERRAAATEQLLTHRARLMDSDLAERATRLLATVQQPASEGSLGNEIRALQEELRLIPELGDAGIDPDRLRALGNYAEGLEETVDTFESQLQSLERQLPEFLHNQAEIAGHARSFNSIPSNLLNDLPANLGVTHSPRPDPPPRLSPPPAPDAPRTGGRARQLFRRLMGNRTVRRGIAVIPFLGIAANAYSAHQYYRQGDYVGVGLDLFGFIPVLGDAVDAFRLGFGEGQTVTVREEREIERQWFERMHPRVRQNFCEENQGHRGCQ